MLIGWTEYDAVRIDQELKEKRLQRAAMMPTPAPRRPIRAGLVWILMTLANRLAPDQQPAMSASNLATGSAES